MKKANALIIVILLIVLVSSFFLIKNFYINKKGININGKEILNYDLGTSFEKNGKKIPRASLVTNDEGLFSYNINFTLKGNSQKFKLIVLVNDTPKSFSLDNDGFSLEKDIIISSSTNHSFKLKDKLKGLNVCNFMFIPYNIQQNPSNVNCIPYLSGIINNNKENRKLFKNLNAFTIKSEKISNNEEFNFLINNKFENGKLLSGSNTIKCKLGEKLQIPVVGNLHNKSDCNYNIFLNNQIIKFNNKFSKSVKVIGGSIFSDGINIIAPNKKGNYVLWGFIHYDLYGQELSSGISSDNFIILQVSD